MGVGFKQVHAFDLLFVACLAVAARRRAFHSPDWRLIIAAAALVLAGGVTFSVHPSPEGVRAMSRMAYSAVVLLAFSHLRIEVLGIRLERTVLGPLFIAVAIAWIVFLVENLSGIPVGHNESAALPSGVHRLGGLTGGNTLILFLCLAAPLVRPPWLLLIGIMLPGLAALSRSVLGVGTALVIRGIPAGSRDRSQQAVWILAWFSVALGLFGYVFAVVPVDPSQRNGLRPSFEPGCYLTPHQAAVRMIRASPVVGVGPGRFVEEFQHFSLPVERQRLADRDVLRLAPHSALLGLGAEQGVLGLLGLAFLLYEIYRRLAQTSEAEARTAALAGLTGLLVGGHFVDWLTLKGLWMWIGLMVARSRRTSSSIRG